jgi:hypothetical protein
VPAKRREDWALPDPKHMDDAGYRAVRDEISARVRADYARMNALLAYLTENCCAGAASCSPAATACHPRPKRKTGARP